MPELICSIHGPYDASLGSCPYCANSGGRPQAPMPLSQDDELPTELPGRPVSPAWLGGNDSDAETQLPQGRTPGGRRFLDPGDEEETSLGRNAHNRDDVTELDMPHEIGAQALLWVKEGPRRGKIYKVTSNTVIGRKDGDVILDDSKVSTRHAAIKLEGDSFVIWDLASANGVYINGDKIRAATPIKENDLIRIGDSIFVFKVL